MCSCWARVRADADRRVRSGCWNVEPACGVSLGILVMLPLVAVFCAALNVAVDRLVYKPLRNAPKLAPLVSAIGVSFVFQNVGLLWKGAADRHVPDLVSQRESAGRFAAAVHRQGSDVIVVVGRDHGRADRVREIHAAGQSRCGPPPRIRWPRN